MRLGFDLDGTVADLQGALAREARVLFPGIDPAILPRSMSPHEKTGGDEPSGETPEAFSMSALTSRQQRELWDAACARHNFWESLDEIEPGALARLSRLARERRWEVIFLTSRPETQGDTAQLQSHRWLAAQGFEMPSVFVVHGSRGKIASSLALDVLVDDRPENCLDIAVESKAKVILVWHGKLSEVPAGAKRLGVRAVPTITEAVSLLEQLDDIRQQPSLMRAVKKALGVATPE
jgi:hypothetical protein